MPIANEVLVDLVPPTCALATRIAARRIAQSRCHGVRIYGLAAIAKKELPSCSRFG